jgi:hypothetical protein
VVVYRLTLGVIEAGEEAQTDALPWRQQPIYT